MNTLTVTFDDLPEEQESYPQVFIIEGLPRDDLRNHRADGYILYKQLLLLGQNPRYVSITCVNDFKAALVMFRQSNYRILHISCHGNRDTIRFSDEYVDYNSFAELTRGYLKSRRIFFSACELGNRNLAQALFKFSKGMHSFVAPQNSVPFHIASAFWVSFYTNYFNACVNNKNLTHRELLDGLKPLTRYFDLEILSATVDTCGRKVDLFDSTFKNVETITFDELYDETY